MATQTLYLPKHVVDSKRHPILQSISQYYGHKDLMGTEASVADVFQQLASIPRDDAIRSICSLLRIALLPEGLTPSIQCRLAKEMLPQNWSRAYQDAIDRDKPDAGVIFHRRALLLVLQFAVMTCRKTVDSIDPNELARRVAMCTIMASDVLNSIEFPFQSAVLDEATEEGMIDVLVPMLDSGTSEVDFSLIGRSCLLWLETGASSEINRLLKNRSQQTLEGTFQAKYSISLAVFHDVLTYLYVRFLGQHLDKRSNPLLLDVAEDPPAKSFDPSDLAAVIQLVSQTPDEMAIRQLRGRQPWAYDNTPLRERPLIQLGPQKYCCPDISFLVSATIDRVYFLLQEAFGKDAFGQVIGDLFEHYIRRLVQEFAITDGQFRTYFHSPKWPGRNEQVADGVFIWPSSVAIVEFKASLLSTHQRFGGIIGGARTGIKSIGVGKSRNRKGVAQLAHSISQIVNGQRRVVSAGDHVELPKNSRIIPVLVCLDESMGFHAVQKYLQAEFEELLEVPNSNSANIAPVVVLTVRDFERLTAAGQSVALEDIFVEYCTHLRSQAKDFTGTFGRFLSHRFGKKIDWLKLLTTSKHTDVIRRISQLLESPTN